jgi:carboxyl-terminal processing protease
MRQSRRSHLGDLIMQQRTVKLALLGIASLALLGLGVSASPTYAQGSAPIAPANPDPQQGQLPQKLVDRVWQLVDQGYLDRGFNGQNWKGIHQQYVNRAYSSPEEAYRAIREMLNRLNDPATRFLTPAELQGIQADASKAGIGLQMVEGTKGQIRVITATEGSPAAITGILPQDVLKSIDGQSLSGMNVYKVASLLQGKPGTTVKLVVHRGNQDYPFTVPRTPAHPVPVRYHTQPTPSGTIGYIRVAQFSDQTASEIRTAIQALEQKGVTGYLLDLRSNPGGSLDSMVSVARMWLREGKILSIVGREGEGEQETANRQALTDKPLVILVDRGTANVSEMLAGSLQAQGRAILVGTPTFGNSRIQALYPLSDGSAVSLTVAKWLTPSGKDINQTGLQPDVAIVATPDQQTMLSTDPAKIGTPADSQYTKALPALSQRIKSSKRPAS